MKIGTFRRFTGVIAVLICLGFLSSGLLPTGAFASPLSAAANGSVVIAPGNPVEIAVANSTVIPEAADIPLAVQQAISAYGAIKGFSVQTNSFDTGCDGAVAATKAANIVANAQHVGVLGPLCSGATIGAAPVFEAAGLVMISASNTAMDLHTYGPNIFNRVVIEDPGSDNWNAQVSGLASVQTWEADFNTIYGHAPWSFAKYAYDAAMLLLTRIEQVSTVDGGGNLVIDREQLATAVRTTTNYAGITGMIALDVNGTRLNTFETAVWTDEFSSPAGYAVFTTSSIEPPWSWMNEDPTHWSLTARPGYLRILTQAQAPTQNLLFMDIPHGDIEVRTLLSFSPTENIQRAGLMIYNSEGNLLALYHAYCDFGPPGCPGEGIFFDHVDDGSIVGSNYATTSPVAGDTYLRIVQDGDVFTAYASTTGREWTMIGTHTPAWEPLQVGLTGDNVTCCSDTEIPADFDFFVIQYPTYPQYIPLLSKPVTQ